MSEFKKFLPKNTESKDFMRPPTEPLHLPFAVRALCIEDEINEMAEKISQERGHIATHPALRLGSELEILLFSKDFDPTIHSSAKRTNNPNYSSTHTKNRKAFMLHMNRDKQEGGLGEMLYDETSALTTLGVEARTPPAKVYDYLTQVQEIQQWVQEKAPDYNILPVVLSQHFHLSLSDMRRRVNLMEDDDIKFALKYGLIDIYHRALPLLRLPENIENPTPKFISTNSQGINIKGLKLTAPTYNDDEGPSRMEGRITNNDYAIDPYLNLLLHLIGIKRGLQFAMHGEELDKSYPLNKTTDNYHYFSLGGNLTNFKDTTLHLLEDDVLREELSDELLHKIYNVVSRYKDISTGILSVEEAREKAYDDTVAYQPVKRGNIFTRWRDRANG